MKIIKAGTRFRTTRGLVMAFAGDAPIPEGTFGEAVRVNPDGQDGVVFMVTWLGLSFSATTGCYFSSKLPDYLEVV